MIILLILMSVPIIAAFFCYFFWPENLYKVFIFIERKKAGLKQKRVTIGDYTLAYLDSEKGEETVIFLHGFGGDKDNFNKLAYYLKDQYRLISLDLAGSGESSRIPNLDYSHKAQVQLFSTFIRLLELSTVHLVGYAWGGTILGKFYPRIDELAPGLSVQSLTLISPGGLPSAEPSELIIRTEKEGNPPHIISSTEDYENLLKMVFNRQPRIPKPIKKYLVSQAIENRPFHDAVLKQVLVEIMDENYNIEDELAKINIHTQIIYGDSDRVHHVSGERILSAGLPSSQSEIIEDCGSLCFAEKPQIVSQIIHSYFKKMKSHKDQAVRS